MPHLVWIRGLSEIKKEGNGERSKLEDGGSGPEAESSHATSLLIGILVYRVVVENHAHLVHALGRGCGLGRRGVREDVDAGSERVDEQLQAVGAECGVRLWVSLSLT